MAAPTFDDQFKSFLKRAGEDLKRMGDDIRTEAQRLITQVQDPDKQQAMKAKAREVGSWAKATAAEVADYVEKGATKAEEAFRNFTQTSAEQTTTTRTSPSAQPSSDTPNTQRPRAAAASKKTASAKTVGPKKRPSGGTPKKKPSGSAGGAAKKTVGRKKD